MNEYILSCCSTTDLTPAQFQKRDIHYICFHFTLDGKEYLDDFTSVPLTEFYNEMARGARTTTSQVSVGEFLPYFRGFLQEGKDILHISLSSGLSGSYGSACIARDMLSAEFPERKIYIVDSLCGGGGTAILMQDLADMRDAGADIETALQWVEANKLQMHHCFFTPDLSYLVRGGRISAAAGWIGTLLNLCPLIEANAEGKLVPAKKIRGKRRAIEAIADKMITHAYGGEKYSERCHICHANNPEDANAVAALIERYFPKLCGKIDINAIGTTLGSHCGPGTVALFFFGTPRTA